MYILFLRLLSDILRFLPNRETMSTRSNWVWHSSDDHAMLILNEIHRFFTCQHVHPDHELSFRDGSPYVKY